MFLLLWALPFEIEDRGPGGPGVDAPDRDWDLTHVHLDLSIHPDDGRIEGAVTLSLNPLLPPSNRVVLDQVDLHITEVLVDGEATTFTLYDDTVSIEVPQRAHDLEVRYSAEPRTGLHFRGTGPDTYAEVWSQGEGEDNRFWIPLPDYPNDRFTSSGRYVVPDDFKVLSNGLGSFDGTAWNYAMDQQLVSYLIMLAAGPYTVQTESWRGRPVEQWLPPDASSDEADSVAGLLPPMLDFFSERTGVEYPYPAYREVYVQRFLYTGMENTTSTVMARRVLLDEPLHATRIDGTESVMAHELAHQWYGDLLTCSTWHELWLNEGFATYMAAEWLRTQRGEEQWASGVMRRYDWSLTSGPLAGRWWSSPDGSHKPSANVYSKGASVLQMLRVMLGEDAFWAGIQLYTQRHSESLVETDDLRVAMEEVSGMHLRWFFDQWTHLGGAPTVDASWSWADGELRVTLVRGDQPWVFPVEIEAGSETRTVWVDGDRVVAVLPMEEPPPYVAVDPRGGLLAKVTTHQSEGMWLAQAGTASHPYARLRAIEALKETGGEQAATWLLALAEDTGSPYTLRKAALDALVDSPHEIHEGLGRLLKDEDPRIRKEAAGTLGAQAGNHAVALEAAWRRERAPDVKAEVLKQWARHDKAAAVRDAETWLRLRRPSLVPNPVHTAALSVLGKHGEARHLDVILQHIRIDSPYDVAYQAMASARLLVAAMPPGVDRKRAESKTSRAVEPLLGSAHLRTRAMAVGTLGAVGDDDSIRQLKTFAKVAIPSVSASADKAVTAIRKRDDDAPPQEDGELEARLLALEEEQLQQEARLKALEERR